MEGSKNAMYEQAGRSRGWSTGYSNELPQYTVVPPKAETTAAEIPAKPAPAAPMTPRPVVVAPIPAPPVVVMPEMAKAVTVAPIPAPPVVVMPEMAKAKAKAEVEVVVEENMFEKEYMPMAEFPKMEHRKAEMPMTEHTRMSENPKMEHHKAEMPMAENMYKFEYSEMEHHRKDCETPVMAFVPMQKWRDLYDTEQGFARGTIFAELDLPFVGEGACRYE